MNDDSVSIVNFNLALYVVISVIIGFVFGFYFNWSRIRGLESRLEPYLQRDSEIKRAEEDVIKSLEQSKLAPAQIKKAEQDVIKSLTAPSR
ncbi:hypothetical protein A2661_01740 [Candidatus Giovannonibacteria bacterium RIFCSPHIGHO2_01_FULL_45_24]|uniref:Uncharacterized protein n=1 Tax=Candidatus Giovannonibacteria bacterium RIFCSPLOWO2_01_FULL_46_32 TaxID=1798353 RepID=A0A1F5XH68_9BACT|nr:MAG: hypothetical protein A2661_01740 [Candidatus Giovannonibacteria bacterium RIFCSPHIGHO2_01_FULL_45_24]OGF87284.1 MAG: hypothetical protein A3B19_03615 [Candidatus Giovannonibacteria bacterium RIFCSPLOWO2_01_FULL_46_32]